MAQGGGSLARGQDEERDGEDECGQDRLKFSGEHNSSSEESDDQHDPDEIASRFSLLLLARWKTGRTGLRCLLHVMAPFP